MHRAIIYIKTLRLRCINNGTIEDHKTGLAFGHLPLINVDMDPIDYSNFECLNSKQNLGKWKGREKPSSEQ